MAYDWAHIEHLQTTMQTWPSTLNEIMLPNTAQDKSKYASIWVYRQIRHIIHTRKTTQAFNGQWMQVSRFLNPHVLSFIRRGDNQTQSNSVWVVANFSEHAHTIQLQNMHGWGFGKILRDRLSGQERTWSHEWILEPYAVYWWENIS